MSNVKPPESELTFQNQVGWLKSPKTMHRYTETTPPVALFRQLVKVPDWNFDIWECSVKNGGIRLVRVRRFRVLKILQDIGGDFVTIGQARKLCFRKKLCHPIARTNVPP